MYVHPQEIDYNIDTLFELIDASGLEFMGFSNPEFWQLKRLLAKAPELIDTAEKLSDRQRYRLIELLDPEVTHYEFFLGRSPITKLDWSEDEDLLKAIPEISPCLEGFPSQCLFNGDYQIVNLSPTELEFMQSCNSNLTVAEILVTVQLDLDKVRELLNQQLILLTPN
jgi:hypothetical protein